jgi:hypothetical protein
MKRALWILALALGLALPSGALAGRTAAQQQTSARQRAAAKQRDKTPKTRRGVIFQRLRGRGVIKPSESSLFENSGIAGGPTVIFSQRNVSRRVTRKGALPGETELVNVTGTATPSRKNKSGWSVRTTIKPARAPSQTLQE